MRFLVLISFSFLLSGCVTGMSFSQTGFTVTKGKKIHAKDVVYDWFLMNAPLPRVKEKLAAKCPGGVVSGVQSHLVTRDWYIVKEYELLAEASCQSLGSAKL